MVRCLNLFVYYRIIIQPTLKLLTACYNISHRNKFKDVNKFYRKYKQDFEILDNIDFSKTDKESFGKLIKDFPRIINNEALRIQWSLGFMRLRVYHYGLTHKHFFCQNTAFLFNFLVVQWASSYIFNLHLILHLKWAKGWGGG